MPKIVTPLTDIDIRKSKSKEKQYKLSDGAGLCLIVTVKGTKYFRFDYSINRKRKSISFGTYPNTTLKDARKKREESKELISNGIDPSQKRKIDKSTETFEAVSNKWLDIAKSDWVNSTYIKAVDTIRNNTLSIKNN